MTIVYQITIKLIIIMSLSTNLSNSMINNRKIYATPDAG
jgi:hypothetical protein